MNDYNLTNLHKIKINNLDFFVTERFLDHYKEESYEKFSLQIVDWLLPEEGTFVDIGTHYGIYSLTAARKLKKGKVFSYEPVEENIQVFQKSIKENQFTNIEVVNKAVSNESGKIKFNIANASDSSGIHKHPNTKTLEKREVTVTTLDEDLLNEENIVLMKIDTEGNEMAVLNGMNKILKNNPQVKLLIEFNPKVLKVADTEPVVFLKYLKEELNFDVYFINDFSHQIYDMTDKLERFESYMDVTSYINILCIPKKTFKFLSFLSHSPVTSGGSEQSLINTIDWLLEKKEFLIHIVIPEDGSLVNAAFNRPISYSIINLPWWTKNTKDKDIGESVGKLTEDLIKVSPALIYTNTSVIPQGGWASEILSLPHIWHLREFGEIDHNLKFIDNVEERSKFISKNADVTITNSNSVKDYYKIDDAKVIYNFVEVKESDIKQTSEFGEVDLKLSFVGKIKEEKGQLDAVKAVNMLVKDGYSVKLIIIGDGENDYIKQINEYLTKEKIEENVILLGFKKDFASYVNDSDLLLVCSKNEAFGRVTLEAMALGKPVVGSNSSGTSELISDGKTGLLYKPGDITDLADKLKYYHDNKEKLKAHGKLAKEYYNKNFSKEIYINKIVSAIKEATKLFDKRVEANSILEGIGVYLKKSVNKQLSLESKLHQKNIQLNQIYDEYLEFQGFKQGKIWRLLQKVRQIKS